MSHDTEPFLLNISQNNDELSQTFVYTILPQKVTYIPSFPETNPYSFLPLFQFIPSPFPEQKAVHFQLIFQLVFSSFPEQIEKKKVNI